MNDPSPHAVRVCIDSPVADASVARGALRVSGWVFDEAGLLEAALLVVNDGPGVRLQLGGVWRPDVGEAYPSVAHASSSGFEGTVDLRAVNGETARVALLVRLSDGAWREAGAVEVQVPARTRERDGVRPRAAFTIAQNEPVMLPVWLSYYERYFDPEDLYVLDHDSSDGSTEGLEGRCQVVPVHQQAYDHHWLKSTVESFQAFLLSSYDTVLFADSDEFVLADPSRYAGLDDYIARMARPAARCVGFNVVHQPEEPPLRFDAPLLTQRRCWHASLLYSKRLLSRLPLRWSEGFHVEHNAPDDPPDPELLLVHLHRVDYDVCLARHQKALARKWKESDLRDGFGLQNRIVEPDEFEEWFRHGPELDAPCELIPEHIRPLL